MNNQDSGITALVILGLVVSCFAGMFVMDEHSAKGKESLYGSLSSTDALRLVAAAQDKFRAEHGRFGTMREIVSMAGTADDQHLAARPGALPVAFGSIACGRVEYNDYLFRVFLPDKQGLGVSEIASGKMNPEMDRAKAAQLWCCYAWPVAGQDDRVYFVDQEGVVRATRIGSFWGWHAPPPDLAMDRSTPPAPLPLGSRVKWREVENNEER